MAKTEKKVAKPKAAIKCPQDEAELELTDKVPATYGGKSGELKVYICPKCGNIQTFFKAPKKKEKKPES